MLTFIDSVHWICHQNKWIPQHFYFLSISGNVKDYVIHIPTSSLSELTCSNMQTNRTVRNHVFDDYKVYSDTHVEVAESAHLTSYLAHEFLQKKA
ncbi:hypothetical protein CEXT_90521 [Caerostris extrusa]|uniref:Uncharacterized protein n=1 Tax=Caerostris extrusa TaxID=172846 RepID=A0AAV4MMT4_CAEEX|nr:hypothetical protein CEXT_90521 [Caerostris extrusa]